MVRQILCPLYVSCGGGGGGGGGRFSTGGRVEFSSGKRCRHAGRAGACVGLGVGDTAEAQTHQRGRPPGGRDHEEEHRHPVHLPDGAPRSLGRSLQRLLGYCGGHVLRWLLSPRTPAPT
eukprot:7178796-Pyramimonas_sp.AAC.1